MSAARQDLYREKYRPQYHFTARQWTVNVLNPDKQEEGWLNDPNGLIFLNGEYHLFAQRWAKCWIHAVSKDLIHWKEVQPAFWDDDRFGTGVQSGSTVYDTQNTSGLAHSTAHPALIAFWSGFDNMSQCISVSLDSGETWTKYDGNPLFLHPERDPKVFWYEPTGSWFMVLSCHGSYEFFSSYDLLHWTPTKCVIPNSYECPDIFRLPIEGDMNNQKWVLVRGDGSYSIGNFDGDSFVEETVQIRSDQGPNFYATMSWGDIPDHPGRRIQIAWMRGGLYPDMPFNQQMSFPCDLSLKQTACGVRMLRTPIPEVKCLHGDPTTLNDQVLTKSETITIPSYEGLLHLKLQLDVANEGAFEIEVFGTSVQFTSHTVACLSAPVALIEPLGKVEMLVDRTSIEVFVNDGEVSLSACFLPRTEEMIIRCLCGSVVIRDASIFPLRSIWIPD